jgi:hypothetical protein
MRQRESDVDWKLWGFTVVFALVLAAVIVVASTSGPDFDPCATGGPTCFSR